jgi:hypothetical protein
MWNAQLANTTVPNTPASTLLAAGHFDRIFETTGED